MSLKINKFQKFNTDIHKVWKAISDSEALNDWFMSGDFKPAVGTRFKLHDGNKKVSGEIISLQAPINLAMSWEINNTDYMTYVWWRLDERKGETKIEFEHSGFKGLHGFIQILKYNRFWGKKIKSLKSYLDEN